MAGHATAEDDRGLVGSSERELIREGLFKPGAAGARPVKGAGIGDLELSESERVPVPAAAVFVGQRRGQSGLPAIKEPAHITGRQAVTDPGERFGVLAGIKPVIQRPEADALLGGLLLGPLVSI